MNQQLQSIESTAFGLGLPVSPEAEQFVLGSILLDDSLFPEVAAVLASEDFSLAKHRKIFAAMHELHQSQQPIEYLTLISHLESKGQLDSVDGIAYISSLNEGFPRLKNIDAYVRIVRERSRLRELILLCHKTALRAMQLDGEPDEILGTAEEGFRKIIDSGTRAPLCSAYEVAKNYPGGIRELLNPSLAHQGILTPFNLLNDMTGGLEPSQLIVLAGRPSSGKTALALTIAEHVSRTDDDHDGFPVAFFSLEMAKESLMKRLLCAGAGVEGYRYRAGDLDADERRRLSATLSAICRLSLFFGDQANTPVSDIEAKCRRMRAKHGLGLIVVDYLQLLRPQRRFENRTQEVASFSRDLKLLAMKTNVPVLALSQLNRAVESRKDKRPQLADLRDSGSIEQDADIVAFIHRPDIYEQVDPHHSGGADLIVAKHRNGPTGVIPLVFMKEVMRFKDRAKELSV